MAILTAQAKFYTGIRCLCVDKNISAALTSSFSLGNKDIDFPEDVPVKDAQGNDTIYPNVYIWRLRRAVADLAVTPVIALTDERYRTYGAGNVINDGYFVPGQTYKIIEITPGSGNIGDTDWNAVAGTTGVTYYAGDEILAATNGQVPTLSPAPVEDAEDDKRNPARKTGKAHLASWTTKKTLTCDFPTYIEIDIEKLGLPEGTDVILNFEEGWLLEDRGRLLPSGAWEYPNAVQGALSPRADNYVQFRTPKYLSTTSLLSAFTRNIVPLRIKQLAAVFPQALGNVTFRIRYNPGRLASLFVDDFSLTPNAQKITENILTLYSFTGGGSLQWNGLIIKRTRVFDIITNSSFVVPNINVRRNRFGNSILNSQFESQSSFNRTRNTISNNQILSTLNYGIERLRPFSSFNSISTSVSFDFDVYVIGDSLQAGLFTLVSIPKYIRGIQKNLQTISTVNCDFIVRPMLKGQANITTTSSVSCNAQIATKYIYPLPLAATDPTSTSWNGKPQNYVFVPNYGIVGITPITNMSRMFYNTTFNQDISSWDVSTVSNFQEMFRGNTAFNQPLNSWNTSAAVNMAEMFYGATSFNQPIGNWQTGGVGDMSSMFYNADSFNQNINTWNTNSLSNMTFMFFSANAFNSPLSNWNISGVTSLRGVFQGAASFNQNINTWNTSNVIDMRNCFTQCESFNQPLNSWNTSNVLYMSGMFSSARVFNQDITGWNTTKVQTFEDMFNDARAFNANISIWNTANVTNMSGMFQSTYNFNQPIGSWNTNKVTDMSDMFNSARAFNQTINAWNTSNVTNMSSMFFAGIIETVFNQPLDNWDTSKVTNMFNMFNGADAFNQDLSGWCVTLIPTAPSNFDSNATAWTLPSSRPIWGTCPP